ncbi:uncharacterized protein LOC124418525 [Lucilia cuprina]|uniref:uncharacterized protein LOC124418525 n=1 Tax=Lucilia cuprina TaxID=7375 RepID=UPI001F05F257|nr:uncharacterized protein LOC124418525 [Lucilia cuprina]
MVDQNKIIVEMLAEQKIQLQGLHNVRKNINNLITVYPIKTEEDLQKMETQINEANEDKYISAIKYLVDGNVVKNLERVLSRELCVLYNIDGICGKKGLRHYKNVYKTIISEINSYSTNAEKEIRTALQVVKKRHFRSVCAKKRYLLKPMWF